MAKNMVKKKLVDTSTVFGSHKNMAKNMVKKKLVDTSTVFGSQGGKTTFKKYGSKHYKKAAIKRWKIWRKKQATLKGTHISRSKTVKTK